MLCDMTEMATSGTAGWTADDSTFGARLALVRQRMAWGNVKEAAVACGLPAESWRRWERDGRSPRNVLEIAAIIADRTGCDFGWLLAGKRLTTYADSHAASRSEINVRKSTMTGRPRPIGGPVAAIPRESTRRPARLPLALVGS